MHERPRVGEFSGPLGRKHLTQFALQWKHRELTLLQGEPRRPPCGFSALWERFFLMSVGALFPKRSQDTRTCIEKWRARSLFQKMSPMVFEPITPTVLRTAAIALLGECRVGQRFLMMGELEWGHSAYVEGKSSFSSEQLVKSSLAATLTFLLFQLLL